MPDPASIVVRELTRRPGLAVLAGGAVVAGFVAISRSRAEGAVDPLPVTEEIAEPIDGSAATLTPIDYGDGYGSPWDTLTQPGWSDPFAGGGSGGTLPQTTPEGCALPKPTTPPGMESTYEWKCDAGSKAWVLRSLPQQLSPGGCPLPRPAPDPVLVAAGWELYCDRSAKRWRYRRPGATTPAPTPTPTPVAAHGRMVVPAGEHRSFRRANGAGPATDPQDFTLSSARTFLTGSRESARMPNGQSVMLVKVRTAPGKPAAEGRWMRPTAGWTWVPAA